jgi:hypothetical protein
MTEYKIAKNYIELPYNQGSHGSFFLGQLQTTEEKRTFEINMIHIDTSQNSQKPKDGTCIRLSVDNQFIGNMIYQNGFFMPYNTQKFKVSSSTIKIETNIFSFFNMNGVLKDSKLYLNEFVPDK